MANKLHSKWQVIPPYDRHLPSWNRVAVRGTPGDFYQGANHPPERKPDELTALMQHIHYIPGVFYKWRQSIEAYEISCTSGEAEEAFHDWAERYVVPWGCTVVKAQMK